MKSELLQLVDFGTASVCSIIINTHTGEEVTSSAFYYLHWKVGLYCDAGTNWLCQHPIDYLEGLEQIIAGSCIRPAYG